MIFMKFLPFLLLAVLVDVECSRDYFMFQDEEGQVSKAYLSGEPPQRIIGPIEDNVIFWHYLPGETEGRRVSINCTDNCTDKFVRNATLAIFVHGFGSSHDKEFGRTIRNGFKHARQSFNLVFVNWSTFSLIPWYSYAVQSLRPVGAYVAKFLKFLYANDLATPKNTIYVGHSLGAQMANFVSAGLRPEKLELVIAADPALPMFDSRNDTERLDSSDANFVNVIHTHAGKLGFYETRGHVDFYPNSGVTQPGCPALDLGICSHSRAYHYLAETIENAKAFPACQCFSWEGFTNGQCDCDKTVYMAWNTPRTARGAYFLRTGPESPFARYELSSSTKLNISFTFLVSILFLVFFVKEKFV